MAHRGACKQGRVHQWPGFKCMLSGMAKARVQESHTECGEPAASAACARDAPQARCDVRSRARAPSTSGHAPQFSIEVNTLAPAGGGGRGGRGPRRQQGAARDRAARAAAPGRRCRPRRRRARLCAARRGQRPAARAAGGRRGRLGALRVIARLPAAPACAVPTLAAAHRVHGCTAKIYQAKLGCTMPAAPDHMPRLAGRRLACLAVRQGTCSAQSRPPPCHV